MSWPFKLDIPKGAYWKVITLRWGSFCGTRIKERKPNPATQTEKKLAKDREQKPLSSSSRNNGSKVHKISKWALRKRMGSKEPNNWEIANSKPMGSVWCEKSNNGPRQAQSNASKESRGLMVGPKIPKDEYEVIGSGKPNEANKSPWEYKVRKRAEEAQGKQVGWECPRENKRDARAHK